MTRLLDALIILWFCWACLALADLVVQVATRGELSVLNQIVVWGMR